MNSQVLIGTSGYSYEDWRGRFYPDRIKRKDMLTYYAGEFPFTEINSTYYTLPSPKAFESLAERTPPDFIFTVKEELREWVPRVRRAWAEAKVTFIAFNNHFNSHAIINARMFKTLLQEPENRKHSGF